MRPLFLWNNNWLRAILIVLWAALTLSSLAFANDTTVHTPKLLLTPQRLRRLERDRTRQTVRWVDFESRINATPESEERGFELALYYVVTHDEKRGREAVEWALAHKCEHRQVALVLDWCAGLISGDEKEKLASDCGNTQANSIQSASERARDALFLAVASEQPVPEARSEAWKQILANLQSRDFTDAPTLYALCEYLATIRATQHQDLRQDDAKFFSGLPVEFLLSLRPHQVQTPDEMTHLAALALVALDPNLESSQFLQSWALEDAQIIRQGRGVAYEFLWADPYLPGVGYQNLDSWVYDSNGRLFARDGWAKDSCWVGITRGGLKQEGCPANWENSSKEFGHLTLIPMTERCIEVPHRKHNNDGTILWKLHPHQTVSYSVGEKKNLAESDDAGLWRVPENAEGRVCTSLDKLKRP